MSDNDSSIASPAGDSHSLVIPAFGKSPALYLDMGSIREAETRIVEAKIVNPFTYTDLEHSFNESFRDLNRHLSQIGFQLAMAKKYLEEAKADVILGSYAEFLQGKPKSHDTLDLRNAHLIRDPQYSASLDRVAQLNALKDNFEGKVKILENVCRYMRQKMRLIEKSGMSNADYYNTQGKK